jgi:hypothetical protein
MYTCKCAYTSICRGAHMYGYTHARTCIQAHKCMHARACQTHHSPARFFERRGVRSRSNKTSNALCTRRISDTSCCALAPSYTSKSSRGVVKTASVYRHRAKKASSRNASCSSAKRLGKSCLCACVRACVRARVRVCVQPYGHVCVCACRHACSTAYVRACMHTVGLA